MGKAELKRLDQGSFELLITIPKEEVRRVYDLVVSEAVENAELPGFRKGKAPREKVEATLDKNKVYEHVLQDLVPKSYVEAVQEQHLRPIINPRVHISSAKEDEDWVIVATAAEAPEVKLGNFKEEAKKSVAAQSLWVPGKDEPNSKKEVDRDQKLNAIIDHLLSVIAIEPSDLLIEEESNHALSRLVDQTNQLGITVEQYLSSTGKTPESLRAEYAQAAKRNLQVEFLLDAIANQEKIGVEEKEIDEMVQAIPDEKERATIKAEQQGMIRAILRRRKALDSLLTT